VGTLLLILFFLILSAFFSGSEIAFVSANKLGIAVKKADNNRRGNIINKFYQKPQDFLSTMLVGNNISLVAFTTLTSTILLEPLLRPFVGVGVLFLLISTLVITIVVLILGEFLPKTYFSMYSTKMLFVLAYPLVIFKYLLAIPTFIMTGLTNFILKYIFRFNIDNAESVLTKLDLEHFIEDSLSDDHDDIDKEILTNALNLGHSSVSHCMIPRTEIISVDINDSVDELMAVVLESKLSRIIVTDGDKDNVIGYVHHQQLWESPESIRSILFDILYVPAVMNLKDLMMQFINDGSSIACVVDEFGGTDGIITLEDILEEIFGNIEDEHDVEDYVMQKINDEEYLLSGRLEIDYIHEKYPELELPEGDYQTLSGYIVMTSELIPELGQQIKLDNYLFTIEEVDETKIEIVRLKLLPEDSEEALDNNS
jgi:CBS domain containing-hemolysin-like protein